MIYMAHIRYVFLIFILLGLSALSQASDSEIELLENSNLLAPADGYVAIDIGPVEELAPVRPVLVAQYSDIPKDVWRQNILPNLKINSKLKLSYTCRFFHQITHEINAFKQEKKEFFERMFSDLINESPKGLKLINYLSKLQCAMRVLQKNQRLYHLNIPSEKKRFRTLRSIRHIPGVDSDFIDRSCSELDINEIERPQALFASRLTGSYFKNRLLKDGLSIAYSIGCVVVSIEVLRRNLSFQADSVPWLL